MNKELEEIVDLSFKDSYPRENSAKVKRKPITSWLPEEYKEKFDNLQKETKYKFGKDLQAMIMRAIDLVDGKIA